MEANARLRQKTICQCTLQDSFHPTYGPPTLSSGNRRFPGTVYPSRSYTAPVTYNPDNSPVIPRLWTDSPQTESPSLHPSPVIPPIITDEKGGLDKTPPVIPGYPALGYPQGDLMSVHSQPPLSFQALVPSSDGRIGELSQYIHNLQEWLSQDAHIRKAEVCDLSARVDSLRDDIARLAFDVDYRVEALHHITAQIGDLSNDVQLYSATRNRTPPAFSGRSSGLPPNIAPSPLKFHPILSPPSYDSPRGRLRWNLLYPSAYVHVDGVDPATWVNMREEQATNPRVPRLHLVSYAFPWVIPVHASHSQLGVSCADVIDTVCEFLDQLVSEQDFNRFPFETRRVVTESYNRNRLEAQDILGALGLGTGIKRLDWLGRDTTFMGIEQNVRLAMEVCGGAPPPHTFTIVRTGRSPASSGTYLA